MNDLSEQHAISDFSDFNNRARFPIDSLILQAQVRANPITDSERLDFIAQHFSGLDFGRGSDPTRQSGYIVPGEYFQVMHAPEGQTFKNLGEHEDFRKALDMLMVAWK